jgi:hypothetical protein
VEARSILASAQRFERPHEIEVQIIGILETRRQPQRVPIERRGNLAAISERHREIGRFGTLMSPPLRTSMRS